MMPASDTLSLDLHWTHGRGDLDPFFAALEQGRILGARCPDCGKTVVPPRPRCVVDGARMTPLDLPPTGIIRQVTTGAASPLLPGTGQATFALVQMTGADNSLLARISGGGTVVAAGTKVRLAPAQGPDKASATHPSQWLHFVPGA
jgi:uncharacterized OB-fold protein